MRQHTRYRPVAALAIAAILAACGGTDTQRSGPASAPVRPGMSVMPDSASAGEKVRVRASGFPPANEIVIGFGPPESEYEVVHEVRTDIDGIVAAEVPVPDWAEPGRDYVWVTADEDNEPRVISDPFHVVAR